MQVTIKNIIESEQKTSKAGKPYNVTTFLGDDGEVYKNIFGKFEAGQIIEGDWVDSEYGRQFKVKSEAKSGGFQRKDDPATQKQIIRQNSLTNAVNYVLGKAQFMDKNDALEFISGKEVIQVATYFAKYSEGSVTVASDPKPETPPASVVQAKIAASDWPADIEF